MRDVAHPYRVRVRASQEEKGSVSRGPDEAYDAALVAALPGVIGCLTAVFAGYTVLHPVFLDGTPRMVMTGVAAASTVTFGSVLVLLRWRPLAPRVAHPLTAALLLVVIANAVTHMVLTGEPRQSSNVMLVVVAAGAILLALRWLLAVLYLTWGVWGVGAYLVGSASQWPHYVIGMASATVLAGVVNQLRRSSVRSLAEARASAEAAAVRDHLTGVSNRRGLAMVGSQLVEQARRQGDAVYCIFVDIDGLKTVNDALGHRAGDDVLVSVADALREVTRGTDVVARWGGDEFCVVGPGPGMAPLELERRVRDLVAAKTPVPTEVWPARVSAGGAMLAPWDSGSLETLLGKADKEMYLRRSLRSEAARHGRRPGDRVTD